MLSIDFSPLFRSSIGFDHLVSLLETVSETSLDSYPPYSIENQGDDRYRLTLAVAGFRQSELTVETQPNWLTVSGRKQEQNNGATYLYRGFTPSDFQRRFQLADFVAVTGASLANGLLTIDLVRELPEAMRPRRIEITPERRGLVQKAKKLLDRAA